MKIIFESTPFATEKEEEAAKLIFNRYKKSKNDINEFEILIDDFPCFLTDGIFILSQIFFEDEKVSEGAQLLSGSINFDNVGLYYIDCHRIERYKGEIIQRVWVVYAG